MNETGLGNFGRIFIPIYPLLLYKRLHTFVLKASSGRESPLMKCIISSFIDIMPAYSSLFQQVIKPRSRYYEED